MSAAERVQAFVDRWVSDRRNGDGIYGLAWMENAEIRNAQLTASDLRVLVNQASENDQLEERVLELTEKVMEMADVVAKLRNGGSIPPESQYDIPTKPVAE